MRTYFPSLISLLIRDAVTPTRNEEFDGLGRKNKRAAQRHALKNNSVLSSGKQQQ